MVLSLNNDPNEASMFDLDDIIERRRIKAVYQPIVFLAQKQIFGFEGLVRAVNPYNDCVIPPTALFNAAKEQGKTEELDILCMEKILEDFGNICTDAGNHYLFLNVDTSTLGREDISEKVIKLVNKYGVAPEQVVIEVNESKVHDMSVLKGFISSCKKAGFLIALDDVGAGFSNLDRIPIARPDIIKVDMFLVRNIYKDFYKQEVLKALVNLSNKVGALVVAEGVESQEEALQVLELGVHMIQGFYFAKPSSMDSVQITGVKSSIDSITRLFKLHMHQKIKRDRESYIPIDNAVNDCLFGLIPASCANFDEVLEGMVQKHKNIECVYVLDEKGFQISKTICCKDSLCRACRTIFTPAVRGTDHSLKKYYYHLMNKRLNKYITSPYVSLATGNLCITYSKTFRNNKRKKYILCIDFSPDDECGRVGEQILSCY